MHKSSTPVLSLTSIKGHEVQVRFDEPLVSSDGGALLLGKLDQKLGITAQLAAAIADPRRNGSIAHQIQEMLRQRVYQIACGYPDANDCNALRADPVFKTAVGRHPVKGADLASQPTVTRLENFVTARDLLRMAYAFIDLFIRSYPTPPRSIILDMDPTADVVYGDQQLRLFNAFEDEYCLMPFHVYEGYSGKLITTVLRPGKTPTAAEIISVLKRIVRRLRKAWPHVIILFRADGHHTKPEVMDWLEARHIRFATGLAPNARLDRIFASTIRRATRRYKRYGRPVRMYAAARYAAQTWSRKRRVICRIQVSERGADTRYIVTSQNAAEEKYLYEGVYCARGRMELFIKDHKTHLESDRTSCTDKHANQFRLFLHSAAYVILHAMRNLMDQSSVLAKAQFDTLRLKLLKLGARLEPLARRLRFHLPASCPEQVAFARLVAALNST
jgi:hypothetical protein